ncbi:sugar phosphate isomerase/epimerase family protein [Candidatus Eisenbacteria bacterium]|uniref:Sugar phosphate isomerase/epimerase family protein n=1 Tax=Eiseniibacteriota bacterium TaxID=2212470 RepID=A0ABV6YLA3_UNCEI
MDRDQAVERMLQDEDSPAQREAEANAEASAVGEAAPQPDEDAAQDQEGSTAGAVEADPGEDDVVVTEGEDSEVQEGHTLVFPVSYPVPLALLRERIPFLIDHGLNVEVNLADTTYNGEVSIRELERLAIELRRNKIRVIAQLPHHDLKLASHDKTILQHSMDALQEGLEIGKILGARIAIFQSGFSNHVRPDQNDWWVEKCIVGLEDLVSRAQDEEVIVALKNTWESDEQVIARLYEAVDSPWFRFCCDVGHAACFSQFAPEEWIIQFRERIANLDFHDNDGMQDQHQACGEGVVGFDVVSETVHQELTEPVNITLAVSEGDLLPSIEHLEECGFTLERSQT